MHPHFFNTIFQQVLVPPFFLLLPFSPLLLLFPFLFYLTSFLPFLNKYQNFIFLLLLSFLTSTGAFSASNFSFLIFLSFNTNSYKCSHNPFAIILGVNSVGNSANALGSFFYFSVKLLGSI